MLIYVRHSDDEVSDPTFIYDPKITTSGKKLAYKEGKNLIKKYGLPDIIYCSPLRRTRLTLKYMLYSLTPEEKNSIKIYNDTDAARYFPKKEKNKQGVSPNTLKTDLPIYETYTEFTERVVNHAQYLEKYVSSDKVVWCITHTTVYKRICRIYKIQLPSHIPFMHHIVLNDDDTSVESIENIGKGDSIKNIGTPAKIPEDRKYCKQCDRYH